MLRFSHIHHALSRVIHKDSKKSQSSPHRPHLAHSVLWDKNQASATGPRQIEKPKALDSNPFSGPSRPKAQAGPNLSFKSVRRPKRLCSSLSSFFPFSPSCPYSTAFYIILWWTHIVQCRHRWPSTFFRGTSCSPKGWSVMQNAVLAESTPDRKRERKQWPLLKHFVALLTSNNARTKATILVSVPMATLSHVSWETNN